MTDDKWTIVEPELEVKIDIGKKEAEIEIKIVKNVITKDVHYTQTIINNVVSDAGQFSRNVAKELKKISPKIHTIIHDHLNEHTLIIQIMKLVQGLDVKGYVKKAIVKTVFVDTFDSNLWDSMRNDDLVDMLVLHFSKEFRPSFVCGLC